MNKLKRTAALFAVILMILMLFPLNAFAASASVRASASSVKVGDTVTVTVTISGNNIGAASGTFSYNSSVLQFVSGSGASNGRIVVYATGSGQSSLSASMTFKAVGEGSSSVSASISQIYDMDEASLGSASGSCSIRVASNTPTPTKTQAPTPTKSQAPTPTKSQTVKPTKSQKPSKTQPGASQNPQLSASPELTPDAEQVGSLDFDVNGKTLTVKTDITEITIPTGSVQTQININEVPVTAVTKYGKTLVYLTDETGAGAFYVYDGTEFTPFAEIAVNARFNVIPFDDSIEIPEGFTEARLTVNNDTFTAWINSEGEYLIFAEDNNGQKGFFRYDIGSGLVQKYVKTTTKTEIEAAEPEPTAEPAQTTMEQKGFLELVKEEPIIMICAAALAAALLILITVIIVNASKLKRIRKQNDVLKSRNH